MRTAPPGSTEPDGIVLPPVVGSHLHERGCPRLVWQAAGKCGAQIEKFCPGLIIRASLWWARRRFQPPDTAQIWPAVAGARGWSWQVWPPHPPGEALRPSDTAATARRQTPGRDIAGSV